MACETCVTYSQRFSWRTKNQLDLANPYSTGNRPLKQRCCTVMLLILWFVYISAVTSAVNPFPRYLLWSHTYYSIYHRRLNSRETFLHHMDSSEYDTYWKTILTYFSSLLVSVVKVELCLLIMWLCRRWCYSLFWYQQGNSCGCCFVWP